MIKSTVQTFKIMAKIKTEKQYRGASERVEELLKIVGNDTPIDDKYYIELDLLSDLVADYEEEYYPITAPTLVETIKLRMYEMKLTQLKLSELLGISPSRVSEYLSGKSEPTLKVAREISKKLNIDANIILGI
jgi:HTH-type transcriptional regulator / antitoxin HigA